MEKGIEKVDDYTKFIGGNNFFWGGGGGREGSPDLNSVRQTNHVYYCMYTLYR